jgi:hypothetical protein
MHCVFGSFKVLLDNACLVYTASPRDGDVINAAAVKEHLARQLSFDSSVIDNNRDFQIKVTVLCFYQYS